MENIGELSALEILIDRQRKEKKQDIPFGIFKDMRGVDFNSAPDIFIETPEFKQIVDAENIQLIIGARGSGKSLLLKYQEHVFLETILAEEEGEPKVLPVWFDMGNEGFESKNALDYTSETQFHIALSESIIKVIDQTVKKIYQPDFFSKFKLWRLKKKANEPFAKMVSKKSPKLTIYGIGLENQNVTTHMETKTFSLDDLRQVLKLLKEKIQIAHVKVIFDEVSTLSKIEEKDQNTLMNSTLQQWFFDFIDIGRILQPEGLSFSIALLPDKTDMGSHFSDSHAQSFYLDYDITREFEGLSADLLDKRVSYYTNEKYKSFTALFAGTRNECAAKDLLDRASSWVPRTFLHLCQLCLNSIKGSPGHPQINQNIVRNVLTLYAKEKERKLSSTQLGLYHQFLKTISESRQNRFVFKSDDLGNLPAAVRKFVYDLYKQEILIRKRSYIIINQALWLGTSAVPGLVKDLRNSSISVLDYKQPNFCVIGAKNEESTGEPAICGDENPDLAPQAKVDPEGENGDEDEDGAEDLVPSNGTPTVIDDLELSTDIYFPQSQIRNIFQRYYTAQLRKDVLDWCQEKLKDKTLEIIKTLDSYLVKKGRKQVKVRFIEQLERRDRMVNDPLTHQMINSPTPPEIELRVGTIKRIVNDVLPYMGLGLDPAERFIIYLERWLGGVIARALQHKDPHRKTLLLEDFTD